MLSFVYIAEYKKNLGKLNVQNNAGSLLLLNSCSLLFKFAAKNQNLLSNKH